MNRILTEEIFKRPETFIIDEEFDKIIKKFKDSTFRAEVIKRTIRPDIYFEKNMKNIERQILKLFNATIMLRFDTHSFFNKLSFGMCIYPSTAELRGKIEDAVENHKSGFYLYDCDNSLVFIDYCMINICIQYNLGGRGLTGVLLHELGHKIYCLSQYKINYPYDKIPTENSGMIQFKGINIPVKSKKFISEVAILLSILSFREESTMYVNSEHLSDSVGVKYGYGTELFKTMDIFYQMTKNTKVSKFRITNFLIKKINESNESLKRRNLIEELLKKELEDENNSPERKTEIKKSLEEIRKIKNEEVNIESNHILVEAFKSIRDNYKESIKNDGLSIIRENDIETYKEIMNEDNLKIINEKLTFKSIDLEKASKIMTSEQVLKKLVKTQEKGYTPFTDENELNPLQKKILENKIKEMSEKYKTTSIEGNVDVNTKIGGGVSVGSSTTELDLKNIVIMPISNILSIVEANDKGGIVSITAILRNDGGKLKFIRFQHSLFKF